MSSTKKPETATVDERYAAQPFRLRRVTFSGHGLVEALTGDWDRIRDLAYEERGDRNTAGREPANYPSLAPSPIAAGMLFDVRSDLRDPKHRYVAGALRYRSTSLVTSSMNMVAFSPLRTSGRCITAPWVRASTVVTQTKAASSTSATSISSRCASR